MRSSRLYTYAFGIIAGLVLALVLGHAAGLRQMPHCQEDASIIGIGSFSGGQWEAYVCGPAVDDYR
jgi:hypothetical protein